MNDATESSVGRADRERFRFVRGIVGRVASSGLIDSSRRAFALAFVALLFLTLHLGAVQVLAQPVREIQINEQTIMSWIFNNRQSTDRVREELEEIIQTRIDLIVAACDLTPEQRAKLELAGAGDIHRFFNEYESLRRTIRIGNVSMEEYQEINQKVQPVRQKYSAGLHSRESLFAKAVPYVLDATQQSQYAEFERGRRKRQYESMVRGTVALIENEVPLTRDQREKFLKLILAEEAPLRVDVVSYYHVYMVLYRISKIPEEQLKPIFLENEWKVMKPLINRGQAYRQVLIREGLLVE
ncbi:MAG TPA: hypothetical protein VMM56_08340 [Planctomycetaceae bacterium]|nr:hypothetical protein [Planctomycetaceae bacterium]